MNPFTDIERYKRQTILPEIGSSGQQKLQQAKVLIVGAGGLGAPLIAYLAAAGIGCLGIADGDTIERSNLHRQILYKDSEVGFSKANSAAQTAREINPDINVKIYPFYLHHENILDVFGDYDIVADGSDNFYTRYLINDACVVTGKILVSASVLRFGGQLSVFNYKRRDGSRGPDYRDLFPVPPLAASTPDCADAGVLGPLVGIMGAMQAAEVIKIICDFGEILDGKLGTFDLLTNKWNTFTINKNYAGNYFDRNEFIQLKADRDSCKPFDNNRNMKEITVSELKVWQDAGKDFQFIDVREPYEYETANLGAVLVPLAEILEYVSQITKEKPVIIHCRSGARSARAVQMLEAAFGFENLYNLKGGILAYAAEIDPALNVM